MNVWRCQSRAAVLLLGVHAAHVVACDARGVGLCVEAKAKLTQPCVRANAFAHAQASKGCGEAPALAACQRHKSCARTRGDCAALRGGQLLPA